MKLFNDLDDIYGDRIIETKPYNPIMYKCPVCNKEYKTKTCAEKHYNNRVCHSYLDVFRDAMAEDALLNIYMNVIAVYNTKNNSIGGRVSMKSFRKSRYYNSVAKFYMFCYINGIRDNIDYLQFLFENINFRNTFQVLNYGIKESVLISYMRQRQSDRPIEACEEFFNINEDRLGTNTAFTIRALERGDIRYDYLIKHIDVDVFVNNLSNAEANNLEKFLENV